EPPREARELGRVDHPDRDRRTVAPREALDLLDRVRERVAVVEDLAQVRLAQVLAYDVSLDLDRALDELGDHGAQRLVRGRTLGLERRGALPDRRGARRARDARRNALLRVAC